jgi:hypothetical protein
MIWEDPEEGNMIGSFSNAAPVSSQEVPPPLDPNNPLAIADAVVQSSNRRKARPRLIGALLAGGGGEDHLKEIVTWAIDEWGGQLVDGNEIITEWMAGHAPRHVAFLRRALVANGALAPDASADVVEIAVAAAHLGWCRLAPGRLLALIDRRLDYPDERF